jgi:hypothetical protein
MSSVTPEDDENNQKLLQGARGTVFSKRVPLAAGGSFFILHAKLKLTCYN